ncbi:MAG TPA: glycoside hydrolase family 18 protein [Bryobacteraceae bacterium]|nr:glycoside hydrolase family 18 protein [Bryobacteraceae bacterium]
MIRLSKLWLACVGCGLAMLPAQAQQPFPKRLVADYGYWSRTQYPPYSAAQIPFNMLTHLNDFGPSFDNYGNLSVPSGFLEPELISKAHASGVKVLVGLGGDFPGLETTSGGLEALLTNLQTFITANGYDGLDIDWEYPSSTADAQFMFKLMHGLRNIFPSPTYVLSVDIPPWGGSGYDMPGILTVIDYINIMMYDCAGPWTDDAQFNSPVFQNPANPQPWEAGPDVQGAIRIFMEDYQVPAAQLNMGTPFYGYVYTDVTGVFGNCQPLYDGQCGNKTVPSVSYGTWVKSHLNQQGWTSYFDETSMVPYMLRDGGLPGFVTYDDPYSTYFKVWYADWHSGLGGTFMWSLDADYDGHSQDLLNAMYEATMNQPFTGTTP